MVQLKLSYSRLIILFEGGKNRSILIISAGKNKQVVFVDFF